MNYCVAVRYTLCWFWTRQRSLGAVEVSSGVGGGAVFVTAEEDIQFTLLQVEGKCF